MILTSPHHTSNSAPLAPLTLGRYRIAASPQVLPGGRFAAQVAISSGQGSASTARVMRFTDDFATHDDAARYAQAQGLSWVNERHGRITPTPLATPQPPLAVQAILI